MELLWLQPKRKIGKPMINFDGSVSFSNMAQMPRYLSPEDFVNKTNIALDAAMVILKVG